MIKKFKNGKKGVYFPAGPTWMRRGTEGHMGEPRRPTRALAWRDVIYIYDIYIYISYIILLRVIVHISILYSQFC